MPSLFRFLIVLLFLAILGFAAMVALVAFVEPREREVSVRVPISTILGD